MSPEQFIIGAAAAAITLLSNSPIVDALGAIAPETPTYVRDYPPWSSDRSYFDTWTNVTHCDYNYFQLSGRLASVQTDVMRIKVENYRILTDRVSCPRTTTSPSFDSFSMGMGVFGWFIPGGGELAFPKETGLDPLRIINDSSIREIQMRLNLAASKVQFKPYFDRDPVPPADYDYDEEAISFNGDDDFRDDEKVILQHSFNAQRKFDSTIASTELPVKELEEVCSTVLHLVKQIFKDFNQLCAAHYAASVKDFVRQDA
ncbi:hypothetical protein FOZ63_008124 [Perkinsus olseni]|uniref:Uncharacterized protein n=1 Tax=Perkinsus olseni TaxID=32597 RepID=A0A7J6RF87_PEROL|nr:hypothetical protein FOZ63_008124 [Perkinsus olseni]KAF4752875.1 hypothetical protein FOZ62_028277 [Perkinsus olseni]